MSWSQPPRKSAFGPSSRPQPGRQPFGAPGAMPPGGNQFGANPPTGSPFGGSWQQPGGFGSGGASPFGPPPGPAQRPMPFPPPPPKRRSPALAIALGTGGAVVLVLIVIAAVSVVQSGREVAEPGPPKAPESSSVPSPSESTSATPSTAASSADPEPTLPPGSQPEPTDMPTASTKPPPKRTGPYADYPMLTDSAAYGMSMGSWACPALRESRAPAGDAFTPWLDGLIDCMMDRYGPPVAKASGKKLSRPDTHYYRGTAETPCGTLEHDNIPWYCSGNQTIYLNPVKIYENYNWIRKGAIEVLFHEFGHHVQQHFNLMNPGYSARAESEDQISRRVELQAECFTWIQVTQLTDPEWTSQDQRDYEQWYTEDQDQWHGKASSYQYWFARALGKSDVGLCNTWVADKKHVR